MAATCAVCHDFLASMVNVYAAKCGHVLHLPCWTKWLERNSNCPECRKKTKEQDLICLNLNENGLDDTSAGKIDSLSADIQDLKLKDKGKSNESNCVVNVSGESGDYHSCDTDSEERNTSVTETASESEGRDGHTASDESGSDESGSDESGSDESGSDESGSDESGSDEFGSDEFGSDESGSDESDKEAESGSSYTETETETETESKSSESGSEDDTESD